MSLPPLHFRMRDGATALAFRVGDDTRARRLDLEPLAVIHVARGEIKPQGGRTPTEAETRAMEDWLAARRALEAARARDDIRQLSDRLGRAAHWAQTRATDAEIAEVADTLLLAMHDLRTVLVRRKAEAPDGPEA